MAQVNMPLPQVRSLGETKRTDRWWVQPLLVLLGFSALYAVMAGAAPLIEERFGIFVAIRPPSVWELKIAGLILATALAMGILPAWRAYRNALSDGLTIRV